MLPPPPPPRHRARNLSPGSRTPPAHSRSPAAPAATPPWRSQGSGGGGGVPPLRSPPLPSRPPGTISVLFSSAPGSRADTPLPEPRSPRPAAHALTRPPPHRDDSPPPAPPAGQRTGDRQPRPRGRPAAPRAALPPPPGAAVGRCSRQAGLPPPPPAARTHRAAGAQQGAPPRALRPGPSMRLRGLFCLCPFLTGSRKSRDSPPSRGEGGRAAGGKKPRQPIVGSRPAGQWGAGPAGGLPRHVTPERREEGI